MTRAACRLPGRSVVLKCFKEDLLSCVKVFTDLRFESLPFTFRCFQLTVSLHFFPPDFVVNISHSRLL